MDFRNGLRGHSRFFPSISRNYSFGKFSANRRIISDNFASAQSINWRYVRHQAETNKRASVNKRIVWKTVESDVFRIILFHLLLAE